MGVAAAASQASMSGPGLTQVWRPASIEEALIEGEGDPGSGAISEMLGGNLCGCSGYRSLLRAAQAPAQVLHAEPAAAPAREFSPAETELCMQAEVDS
jgi:xanthine dehydrogenase iron-sulfur cluster and FAD-binding subunit A